MKYRNVKARITAVVAVVTILLASVPIYAGEPVELVSETIETSSNGDNSGGEQNDNGESVVELTVTVEAVTPDPTPEAVINITTETPEAATETSETQSEQEIQNDTLKEDSVTLTVEQSVELEGYHTYDTDGAVEANTSETALKLETPEGTSNKEYDDTQQGLSRYKKELSSDVVTSEPVAGKYNATFTITETKYINEEPSDDVRTYSYTVSGFRSTEDVTTYVNKVVGSGELSARSGSTVSKIVLDSLVDADKKPKKGEDWELCWAASVANMLELSGWNKAEKLNSNGENVSNEDDILDTFVKYFNDKPGHRAIGLEWFFNGINKAKLWADYGWPQLKSNVDTDEDGYTSPMLPDYCSDDFINYYDIRYDSEKFIKSLECLNVDADGDRCAIGIGISWAECDDNGKLLHNDDGTLKIEGGHALTLVGYSTDKNGVPNTITIVDSDDFNHTGWPSEAASDRRNYKNTYATYPIEYYDGCWHIMNYYTGNKWDAVIDDIVLLKYYDENTKYKIETEGTKDLGTDFDFSITQATLTSADGISDYFEVYQGDTLLSSLAWLNRSLNKTNVSESPISYRFVISKDGNVIKNLDYSDVCNVKATDAFSEYWFENVLMDSENPLEPGEYTVSYIINYKNDDGTRNITEAYYNNNTLSNGTRFVVIKRVTEDGKIDYVVVPDVSNNNDNHNNIEVNNTDNEYQEMIAEFIAHINDYSETVDQTSFENDENKVFEFTLPSNTVISNVTEADLENAEISFDYSVAGNLEAAAGGYSGIITTNIALTKNDYAITRNADGTISMVFTNDFMRKLPKGTHYFKLKIAGQMRIFKIEIK